MVYENVQNENYAMHWHTATEIIMPLEGAYEAVLLKKEFSLRENDILIIPSQELHSLSVPPSAENGRRFILMFEPTLLYSLSGLSDLIPVLYNLNLITPEQMPALHKTARALLLAIREEYWQGDALKNAAIYTKIIELYIALVRYYSNGNKLLAIYPEITFGGGGGVRKNRRQEYVARLSGVFEYIENHLLEDLSLEQVADIANFSKFHFSRIFKEFTNLSFNHYIQQKRVKKAEALLLNPTYSIADAALDAGFKSISTFNRIFRKIKHYTPSEYKKMFISQP
ncbi:MAG: AraC family transcriptional regulator [Treponema sp.]|jgi:AraC-like DNA-binding protein|nr:AraC family transcriptional regulator [Treponema sp.]